MNDDQGNNSNGIKKSQEKNWDLLRTWDLLRDSVPACQYKTTIQTIREYASAKHKAYATGTGQLCREYTSHEFITLEHIYNLLGLDSTLELVTLNVFKPAIVKQAAWFGSECVEAALKRFPATFTVFSPSRTALVIFQAWLKYGQTVDEIYEKMEPQRSSAETFATQLDSFRPVEHTLKNHAGPGMAAWAVYYLIEGRIDRAVKLAQCADWRRKYSTGISQRDLFEKHFGIEEE